MGGRGASSGRYYWRGKWHTYGDEYKSVLQYRNIKFVKTNEGSTTAPMETMTNGRVYVTVGSDDQLKSITYYTGGGSRRKQIDLSHPHNIDGVGEKPHVHIGYKHNEFGDRKLTKREKKLVDLVINVWNNRDRS